jgi:hypothetical protein
MLSFNRGVTEETQDPSFFVDDSLPSPFGSVADTIQDAFQGFPPVHNNIVQDSFPPIRGGAAASCSIHEVVAAHGITFTSPPQQPPQQHPIPELYPHCHQEQDSDFDSYLKIDWSSCSAAQVYDICASPHMQCGAAKSMTYVLQFAVKQLTGVLSCFCSKESDNLKGVVGKSLRSGCDMCCLVSLSFVNQALSFSSCRI